MGADLYMNPPPESREERKKRILRESKELMDDIPRMILDMTARELIELVSDVVSAARTESNKRST